MRHAYKSLSLHSASLNPTSTKSSATRMGRFTNIPSVAKSVYCSASVMLGSLSFSCNSLYFKPLVLKNDFSVLPLFLCQLFISRAVGFSSFMFRTSKLMPCASNHFRAFWVVEHFGYSKNNIRHCNTWRYILLVCFFTSGITQAKTFLVPRLSLDKLRCYAKIRCRRKTCQRYYYQFIILSIMKLKMQ